MIITPTNGALFNSLAPIEISGKAHADAFLKQVTIIVNGGEIHSDTYLETAQITDADWTTSWTPPGDGTFIVAAIAEDWAGNVQSGAAPRRDHSCASAAPAISIAPTVITSTLQISPQVVALGGSASASQGAQVEVQTPGGSFSPAIFDGTAWQFNWRLDDAPDGASYAVSARVTDALGRTATANQNVTVDLVAPATISPTLAYRDQGGTVHTDPDRRDDLRRRPNAAAGLDRQQRRQRHRRLPRRVQHQRDARTQTR